MNMIPTTSTAAVAAPPLAAPLPAAPGLAAPVAAAPQFFAQFLGLAAAAGAAAQQDTDSAADAPADGTADKATAAADTTPAAPVADLPAMAMLMMPPPLPPAVQGALTAGAAGPQTASASAAAAPVAGLPAMAMLMMPPPLPPAVQGALTASAGAAGPQTGSAAGVSGQVSAAVATAVADAAPAPASPRAPKFAAVFAAAPAAGGAPGAIALPQGGAAPLRAEQAAPAEVKAAADALPAKAAEAGPRAFTADASGFGVAAPAAPSAAATGAGAVVLEGAPQQWQQTLREALGERLQTQVGSNSEHAVIRLDPPQMGRIEIAIRHSAGALQVTLSATHGEVVRQLNTIGDSVRHQLSQQAFSDVALVVTPLPARAGAAHAFADGGGRQRGEEQRGQQRDDAQPGRALSEADQPPATFAMQPERNLS